MFYTVYKTTNQVNGKFYIGTHKTADLNDDYLGSGKYLKYAIQKYGAENFKKEILFVFNNPEEMFAKEAEIVTEEFLSENNTYNLKKGGFGGFDYVNSVENITHSKQFTSKAGIASWQSKQKNELELEKHLSRWGKILQESHKLGKIKPPKFSGKKHKAETKAKISLAAKSMLGTKNSQYGTIWITDGSVNKKISKEQPIPFGWKKGRVL